MSKRLVVILITIALTLATACGMPKTKGFTETAVTQILEGDYAGAIESLVAATEAGENAALIAREQGIALMGMGNLEEAVDSFLHSLTYSDSDVDYFDFDVNFYLAECYEHMRKYQDAIDTYTAIIGLSGKDVTALSKRGAAYLQLGDKESALEDFNKALELDENNYDLRIEVASKLFDASMDSEGQELLNNFLVEKDKKLSKFEKGKIYFYMKDYENAKQLFEEAREDDDTITVLFLGKAYEYLNDYNYAISTYQNYLSTHPDEAIIYNHMGLAKIKAGDYVGAREAFSAGRSIESNGMDQTLWFNEIVACEKGGEFEAARNMLQSYISRYPDDEEAVREFEFLRSR